MTLLAPAHQKLAALDEALRRVRAPRAEGGLGVVDAHRLSSVGLGLNLLLCAMLAQLHSSLFCRREEDDAAIAANEKWEFVQSETFKAVQASMRPPTGAQPEGARGEAQGGEEQGGEEQQPMEQDDGVQQPAPPPHVSAAAVAQAFAFSLTGRLAAFFLQ